MVGGDDVRKKRKVRETWLKDAQVEVNGKLGDRILTDRKRRRKIEEAGRKKGHN